MKKMAFFSVILLFMGIPGVKAKGKISSGIIHLFSFRAITRFFAVVNKRLYIGQYISRGGVDISLFYSFPFIDKFYSHPLAFSQGGCLKNNFIKN